MSRARLLLVSVVAALSVVALLASSASAKITFQWKVNGSILKAGEGRTFTTTSDGRTFHFSGTAGGSTVLLLSTEISVEPGARIIGGQPGTNEEIVMFSGVTVDRPAGCTVESLQPFTGQPVPGLVTTAPLITEIVEGENGEVLILFKPKIGNIFTTLRLLNKTGETCPLNLQEANVTGSVLALPLPQLTEVLTADLDFEAAEKNFFLFSGTLNTAGLSFAGNPAHLTGLALVLLTSHEKFGAF